MDSFSFNNEYLIFILHPPGSPATFSAILQLLQNYSLTSSVNWVSVAWTAASQTSQWDTQLSCVSPCWACCWCKMYLQQCCYERNIANSYFSITMFRMFTSNDSVYCVCLQPCNADTDRSLLCMEPMWMSSDEESAQEEDIDPCRMYVQNSLFFCTHKCAGCYQHAAFCSCLMVKMLLIKTSHIRIN